MFDAIKKWFAALVACIMAIFSTVQLGEIKKPAAPEPPEANIVNDIANDSNLSPSVLLASKLKNKPNAVFTDAERSGYLMRNGEMSFYHDLSTATKFGNLKNAEGVSYFGGTFDAYYTDLDGHTYYASKSNDKGRPNTIRLGEYYYESHIRDMRFEKSSKALFWIDKTYHIYSDRLYQELVLVASEANKKLGSFGAETLIPVSSVNTLQIKDKNGIKNTLDGIDNASVEYVAFDIKDAGVAGFIIPSDGSTAYTSVSKSGDNYVVTQAANFIPGTGVNKNDETGGYALNDVRFGSRIYNDMTHSFAGIDKAAELERNPLTGITVRGGNANGVYLGYEYLRGSYKFAMDGTDFTNAYQNEPDKHYACPISIVNDASDRDIFIRMNGRSGGLEAAALLDSSNRTAAMDVQVGKNFQGDGGEPFYSVKDYLYGDSIFPLALKAGTTTDFTLLNLYQNWGKFPLKQISSIEFHVSYYHLSTGVTECNCIAPYYVSGKDGWVLPDFRGRSGNIWKDQPQFNSTGKLYFAKYRSSFISKNETLGEYTGSKIRSQGLAYVDMDYYYTSDCGSYDYTLRHFEHPSTDENRTFYGVDITFNRDMSFSNFMKDFSLFSYDSRGLVYEKSEYLNEKNQPAVKSNKNGLLPSTEYFVLGKDAPYYGYLDMSEKNYEEANRGFGSNFGLLVRDSDITVGGKKYDGNFVFRNVWDGELNIGSLTLNEKQISFKAGDTINLELVLVPWGKPTDDQTGTMEKIRVDSALQPQTVTSVETGTFVEDDFLAAVKCEDGIAEFTVQGGRNNQAVRVNGFESNVNPDIYILENGIWQKYEVASGNGYDGCSIFYDELSGLYDFSFVYETADPDTEYTFRLVQL